MGRSCTYEWFKLGTLGYTVRKENCMVGIHFITNMPVREVLEGLMFRGGLSAYFWYVDRYIPLIDNGGIDKGLYSPADLKRCIACLSDKEVAENFCMFGSERPHRSAENIPKTFDEYLNSSYKAVLVCTDICLFDFYCKDINVLLNAQKALSDSATRLAEEVHIIRDQQHHRTGFNI